MFNSRGREKGAGLLEGYCAARKFPHSLYRDLIAGLRSLVGFLLSGTFLGRAYFDCYYMIVACIAILRRICLSAWAEQPADEMALSEVAAS